MNELHIKFHAKKLISHKSQSNECGAISEFNMEFTCQAVNFS